MQKSRLLGVPCAFILFLFTQPTYAVLVDLGHPSAPQSNVTNLTGINAVSIVFDASSTFSITSTGILFDPLPGGATEIEVEIYDMSLTGGVGSRNSLLDSATASVTDVGLIFYDIPINFTFNSGTRYNVAFSSTAAGSWGNGINSLDMYSFNYPDASYTVGGLLAVLDGGADTNFNYTLMPHVQFDTTAVPIPAAVWLFFSGLLGLVGIARRKQSATRNNIERIYNKPKRKRSSFLGTALGCLIIVGTTHSANAAFLYATNEDDQLLLVNTSTGAATTIGTISIPDIKGLAFDSNNNILYGADVTTNQLVTINTTTGAATAVGTFGGSYTFLRGLTFDPVSETLYGADENTNELVTIDTSTGLATSVGALGNRFYGLAFDPGGILYGVDVPSDKLWTINTSTGVPSEIGATGLTAVQDIAFMAGTLYGTDVFTEKLYTINISTGVASEIGSLGIDLPKGLAPSAIPIPATVWLFGSGLLGLIGVARRKKDS